MSSNEDLNDRLSGIRGSFRRTINGIRKVIEADFKVAVNMVIMRENLNNIIDTALFIKQLGVNNFCVTKALTPPNNRDCHVISKAELSKMFSDAIFIKNQYGINIDSLEHYPLCSLPDQEAVKIFSKRKCSAAKTTCTIGAFGDVRPCSHAPHSYGNLSDENLSEIWLKMQEWRDGSLVPNFCKTSCNAFPELCGGGCRIEAERVNKNISGQDPFSSESDLHLKESRSLTLFKPLNTSSVFIVRADVKKREEGFGYALFRNPRNWVLVNNDLADILGITKTLHQVSIPIISEKLKVNYYQATRTVNYLISKHIIEQIS